MYWATRISGIGFEMAVPAGIGFWLDRLWGTAPWLVVVGACLGFAVAMFDIARLARQTGSRDSARGPAQRDGSR
jgi:F0F1-type ATP synthase assembly protein I